MAVLDIRGTHGSGKSYVVSQLLTMLEGWEPIEGIASASKGGPEKLRHIGYSNQEHGAAIVGSYKTTSGFGGGCDLLYPEEVVRRVKLLDQGYDCVVLEGVLVSHTFQRYHALAQEIVDYRFCFLDTPLEQCLDRVRKRREGSTKKIRPFKPDNIIKDWHQIARVRDKCLGADDTVVDLNWEDPMVQVLEEMGVSYGRV